MTLSTVSTRRLPDISLLTTLAHAADTTTGSSTCTTSLISPRSADKFRVSSKVRSELPTEDSPSHADLLYLSINNINILQEIIIYLR